ncbi:MAG TPA: adenylate/guanylate cyclase domain-containing protein [Arenimonas sp.]|nr:adenylate/guanylate cyclase domain-containing protein [Arenimonas sp.]
MSNAAPLARILVVDDETANRDYLQQELEELGYAAMLASDGEQALAVIEMAPPDCVLLDIRMPGMDGFEVLQRIKSDATRRHIPVLIVSAESDMRSVLRGIELGADDYLTKPIDDVLLKARLLACLQRHRWRQQERHYMARLEAVQQRNQELLQVMLPAPVVAEWQGTGQVVARKYEEVAVLFTDVVGFTAYCDVQTPTVVLDGLQHMVMRFEEITAAHGLQKIQTIGDAYLATAGMLQASANPVLDAVRCALAMQEAMQAHPAGWQVRAGVHVGPLMAGIVGHRQYQYSIWGDTVNTAARVQEHGRAGKVCVSEVAWPWVAGHFPAQSLGSIELKGKEPMELLLIG